MIENNIVTPRHVQVGPFQLNGEADKSLYDDLRAIFKKHGISQLKGKIDYLDENPTIKITNADITVSEVVNLSTLNPEKCGIDGISINDSNIHCLSYVNNRVDGYLSVSVND